jgi:hypothetical protein
MVLCNLNRYSRDPINVKCLTAIIIHAHHSVVVIKPFSLHVIFEPWSGYELQGKLVFQLSLDLSLLLPFCPIKCT